MNDTDATFSEFDWNDLKKSLSLTKDDKQLFRSIVDAPFDQKVPAAHMFLGIIVLLLVDNKTKEIKRIALSQTEQARNTTTVSVVPFEEIKIPLHSNTNIISQALISGEQQDTTDWKFLFTPALSPKATRINQASAGIAYSAVSPFAAREGGALIFSYYLYEHALNSSQREFINDYTKLVDQKLGEKTKV
jgi:hypothetical protein